MASSLNTTLVTSPSRSRLSRSRGPSSADFLDQIRQLEMEGERLRRGSDPGSPSKYTMNGGISQLSTGAAPSVTHYYEPSSSYQPPSLATVTDITTDQRSITDLRMQLESQKKEMDQIQKKLFQDTGVPLPSSLPLSPSILTSPLRSSSAGPSTTRKSLDTLPQPHMEKALKESQEHVASLRKRLEAAKEVSEEQRKQFRAHIEELKSKLQETVVNRDSIMDLRQREAESQENLIRKLQATLRQLQEAYSVQEKTLQETGSKTDKLSQNLYVADTSLNQIRAVIASVEKKRGKSFYDSEPIDKQSSTMVVHTLERCMQEMESDLETKAGKMKQLENDLEELQKSSRRTQDKLIVEHQQRLSQLTEEHERQLQAAADRATNAREQAANLQSQITLMQEQLDKQAQMKDDHIRELENKITSLKEDHDVAKKGWSEKREALELAVDQVQKELNVMRSEKQEAVQTAAAMETRIEDYQLQVEKLSDELDTDREQMKKLWQREDEANKRQIEMESRLHEKDKEIERLEMLMDSVKAECELTLKDRVASIEKDEKLKTAEQITTLTIQLQTLTEKSTRMTYEIETLQTENGNLKKQVTELTEKNQDARVKIETMEAEKTNLGALMEDRINDCQRLTQERDYYFGLLEERNQELKTLQAENEQLSTRLDEKERNFTALQRQSTDMSHAIELNSKSNDELKLERERLLKSIEERTIELEELKLAKSNITRKLKIREKRLKDIELDKNKLIEELQIKRQDIDAIIKEKDGLYQELKDSRYEVATLSEERDEIQKQKEEQKKQLEGELDRLTQKYVALQQEYRIAQKAIKTKEAVDGKAVKYADKMQKEVTAKRGEIDSLRSKVHWLEECLDAALKDKQALKQERKKLSSSLNNSSTQNEKLADQLEGYAKKNEDLKSKCDRLETALEKAAVKHAEAVAKLETMEQEMASMKLRHQLDIKALERLAQPPSRHSTHVVYTGTPTVSTSVNPKSERQTTAGSQGTGSVVTQGLGRVSTGSLDELPVLHKPGQEKTESTAALNNVAGDELRTLLTEMKSLIMNAQQQPQPQQQPAVLPPPNSTGDRQTNGQRPYEQSSNSTDSHTGIPVHSSSLKPVVRNGNQHRQRSQSSRPSSVQMLTSDRDTIENQRPPRPQSSHTSYGQTMRSGRDSRQTGTAVSSTTGSHMTEWANDTYSEPVLRPQGPKGAPGRVNSDAQELCKRLEDKIERLTQMGGHLQQENKEMAELIKDQGTRLKRVKESERSLHPKMMKCSSHT